MHAPVLFIHGFASFGRGQKALQLEKLFEGELITPDLSHRPLEDVARLKALIDEYQIKTVVGSSLGGFYALLMALHAPVQTILINPSLRSPNSLRRAIGTVECFNGTQFTWSQQQIDELAQLGQQISPEHLAQLDQRKILLLLAEKDEVIDYRYAPTVLPNAKIIIDHELDHRFADLQPYAELIQSWEAK